MINGKQTSLYERAIYSLYRIKDGPAYGYKTIKLLKHLKDTQWLSKDELISYQEKKLRRLIDFVYNNVPYYHGIMSNLGLGPQDIRTVEDLRHFPILTKNKIKENYQTITSKKINDRHIIKAATSGTTGVPLTFYRDMNTRVWTDATFLRGMSWAGYSPGKRAISFSDTNMPSFFGKARLKLINEYSFPAFAGGAELAGYIDKIRSLRPFCLKGMASNLYRISSVCEKNGINDIKIPVIFTTAEMLYDFQREFLEKQFKSNVFDYYGCNEIGSLAYECEQKNKHISDEHLIIEYTDSQGNNVINALGETTITDLDNYAMPFIRYKNGDVGILSSRNCECKRNLTMLKSIEGRSQDFLRTSDGNYIPSIFFPGRFRNLKGLDKYQIIQTDSLNITLKIVKNQFYTSQELQEMIRVMTKMLGDTININIDECKEIPLTGRGKTRLVISHLPQYF